jgi:energy-coupling factor transporter ATP-binding protein EcfA2
VSADLLLRRQQSAADLQLRQQSASADLLLRFLPVAVCGALAAGLALDFYLHESPTHIKRHMLRTLRSSRPPAALPPAPALLLPVPQRPLPLAFLPRLLLGPSGCGKSTLLGTIATTLPAPAPVVLVRMRLPATLPSEGGADAPPKEARVLLDAAARQVFSQIGFPLRRSLIGGALSRGFTLWGERMQAELSTTETSDRLVLALYMLFEACEALKLERQKTMAPLDAAPVLLFDGVQDLIKDARLARAGGRMVLSLLGTLLVSYCVDRRAVRAVVAGSSAELCFAFEDCSPLRGARWDCYTRPDPEVRATTAALVARGYSEEEARGIVDLCGTRLRLLGGPLAFGAAVLSFDEFSRSAAALGSATFASAFHRLSLADAAALGRLLDSIEACDVAAEGAGGRSADTAARPVKQMLTEGLQHLDMAPILYFDRNRELSFQSLLHRRTWARLRGRYVAPAPAGH